MLNRIIRFSIRNKLVISLFIIGLIAWGTFSLTRLPVDALPDITSNQVQVITVSPTLAAPEVERLITFPIEQASANIPGMVELRSISRFGLSVVTIVFSDETDVYWARQQVSERLITVKEQIPEGSGIPELAPSTTGLGEIYQYVVKPAKGYEQQYSLADLRTIQDWIIRRQLLGTPGVADISSFGGHLKQYEVAVMPDRLKSMGTSVAEVFQALEQNNQNSGGAYIEKNATALFIRTEGLATSLDDIRSIFIRHTSDGIPVYLRDVAEVRIGHAVRYGAMVYEDEGEVAGAVVLMLKGANASQVVAEVKRKMAAIKETLPLGIIVEPFYDRTKMVDNAIGTVKKNLVEGALIVVLVLVLFLGNLRAGLIVASVIPLSMLFAVIMMDLFGISGNLMSLGALDFGLIVDGAVIIVEAVLFRLYHSKTFAGIQQITGDQMDEEVAKASGKMMNAAIFGQIIILVVYLPILSLVGIEGKMFRPMAQTVAFALVGAFLLSVTYVPMVTSLFLSKKLRHRKVLSDRLMDTVTSWYRPLLKKSLAFPKVVVAGAVVLFALTSFLMNRLGGEFIPELEEGDFAVDTRVLPGSALSASVNVSRKGAEILKKRFPEIEKIVTRIGAGEIPTDPMPIEVGDMIILLKDKKEWTSAETYDELANKMSAALSEIPGVTAGFQFPVQMRFNELISGARQDIVCKIYGENLDSLVHYADQMGDIIRQVKGAHDIYIESISGLPQVVVKYNREAMSRYRLSVNEVNRLIRAAFAGESAGLVYENERRFDLVVRLSPEGRTELNDINQLLVPTPMGSQIPLYQVADVQVKDGFSQIQRENARRRIVVGFNVRGRDVESVVEELQGRAKKQLRLYAGYSVHYGGQFENLQEAKQRLAIAVPVALLLIFLLLYFSFGSIRYALLIFSAIPLSAIGGVLALTLRGMPFSISAGIGFIALFGVAVLNGIVLIAEFNRLKQQGISDINQLIMEGTTIRLRPVLMTAAVASLGFLPMALSQGPGAEVQRPLATVVIGGLITATMLTLVVLPIVFRWVEQRQAKRRANTVTGVFLLAMLFSTFSPVNSFAQPKNARRVTLDSMLQILQRENLSLQAGRKQMDYWSVLSKGTVELPKTQLGLEYGNINSAANDTKLFLNQGFSLPVVYRRQQQLYEKHRAGQEANVSLQAADLRKETRRLFYSLAELDEKEKLLVQLDSVFTRFRTVSDLRVRTGEAAPLERTSAEAQAGLLALQIQELKADRLVMQEQLARILNTDEYLLPQYERIEMELPALADAGSHPLIRYQQQQVGIAEATAAAEKAKLTPDLSVGYGNQSIVGYQSPDGVSEKYYGSGDRFHVVNFTMSLPLFMKATRSRVKAAAVEAEAASLSVKAAERSIYFRKKELLEEYRKLRQQADYYLGNGNAHAEMLQRQAGISFTNGEINYLQWTQLMNQSLSIRIGYLEAVRALNQTIIELEYINGN